jgi:hypothetical protein
MMELKNDPLEEEMGRKFKFEYDETKHKETKHWNKRLLFKVKFRQIDYFWFDLILDQDALKKLSC